MMFNDCKFVISKYFFVCVGLAGSLPAGDAICCDGVCVCTYELVIHNIIMLVKSRQLIDLKN
jgi:hypothetical protein